MLDSLLYSFNAVIPIFLVVLLGRLLKKFNFLRAAFFEDSDKFVFRIALPVTLFVDLAFSDTEVTFNFGLIAYCCVAVVLLVLLLCLIVPIFEKKNERRGVIVQGIYRSNFAILGFSIMENMFGDEGLRVISTVLPFAIILFNALAVVILSVFAPMDEKQTFGSTVKEILVNIVKNPLIIALVIAFPFLLFPVKFPSLVTITLGYIEDATLVLALMSLGANIEPKSLKADILPVLTSSVCKTVFVPLAAVTVAVLLGFRGADLGAVFILFGGPVAVSSYIMAKNMKGDHVLAAELLLCSTVMSALTLFFGTFILKSLALI